MCLTLGKQLNLMTYLLRAMHYDHTVTAKPLPLLLRIRKQAIIGAQTDFPVASTASWLLYASA